MDDAADPGFSRAPQLEDLISLCRALNREGARYVLISGFAVILHGLVRTTKDIDLLVDPSQDNIRKVKRALASLPDNAGRSSPMTTSRSIGSSESPMSSSST